MKISNIILTATFAFILVWILTGFITLKSQISESRNKWSDNKKEQLVTEPDAIVREQLEEFDAIHVTGKGNIVISQANENSIITDREGGFTTEIKNRVLHIDLKNVYEVRVEAKKMIKILVGEKANASIKSMEMDTLKIAVENNGRLMLLDIKTNLIELKTKDKAHVDMRNIDVEAGKAIFEINGLSRVTINGTERMDISVKKSAGARYKAF